MSEQLTPTNSSVQTFVSLQDVHFEDANKESSHLVVSHLDFDNGDEQITCHAPELDVDSESDGNSDLNNEDWDLLDSSAAEISKHDIFVKLPGEKWTGHGKLQHKNKNFQTCQESESITDILDKNAKLELADIARDLIFKKVNRLIYADTEVVILHALCHKFHRECAIKVFRKPLAMNQPKETLCINKRTKRKPMPLCHNPARREMYNLIQMQQAGIACPSVLFQRKNILITSFIGKKGIQAPTLKNAKVGYDKQIVNAMKALYNEVHLVHTNLSVSNILWHDNKCYIMNASHTVSSKHKHAFCYLIKSFEGFSSYLTGWPYAGRLDVILKEVTGSDCVDKLTPKMWSKIERITKRNRWEPLNYEDMCIHQP